MLLAHAPSDMRAAAVALAGVRARLANATLASTLSGRGFRILYFRGFHFFLYFIC